MQHQPNYLACGLQGLQHGEGPGEGDDPAIRSKHSSWYYSSWNLLHAMFTGDVY